MSEVKSISAYFPPPWEACATDEGGRDYSEAITVKAANGNYVAYHSSQSAFLHPDVARLIAAAPELLEALRPFAKFACDLTDGGAECDCHRCKARTAIQKATA